MVLQDREGGEQGGHGVLLVVDLGDVVGRNQAPSRRGSSLWVWRSASIPATQARRSSRSSRSTSRSRLTLGEATDPAQALADRAEPGGQGDRARG